MSVNQGRLAGGFWGLVEQKGPWKTTSNDAARSHRSQPSKKTGGGIQIGGTKNAGHAGWYASINPQVDPNVLPRPPRPSQYVQKSIIVPSTMMPKTPKGTILRNAPTETMRLDPSGVQKAGHNYVPHFQPSGEEAPRVNETPSLMGESSISSDGSSYFSASSDYRNDPLYQHLQQTLNETVDTTFSRPDPDVLSEPTPSEDEFNEQMYQDWRAQHILARPPQEDFGLQTSPETMETTTSPLVNTMETATSPLVNTMETATSPLVNTMETATSPLVNTMETATSPLVNTMETATSPLVETVAALPYLEAPPDVPMLEQPPGVPTIEPAVIYPGISEQEMLADRKPKRKIKKKPTPKIDSEEFEKFSKNNRDRNESDRDETNRKTPKPKIPTAEFEAHTSAVRNRNRKGAQGESSKRKGDPKPTVKKDKGKRKIKDRIKELSTGLSLQDQIKELEKRVAAYERLEKKSSNGLSSARVAALKNAREKLAELKKKRK